MLTRRDKIVKNKFIFAVMLFATPSAFAATTKDLSNAHNLFCHAYGRVKFSLVELQSEKPMHQRPMEKASQIKILEISKSKLKYEILNSNMVEIITIEKSRKNIQGETILWGVLDDDSGYRLANIKCSFIE